MGEVSFVEVSSIQEVLENWKEIQLNIGSAQNTLQDIKLPETAGGYVFKESHKLDSTVSNRFIYWRSVDSVLELIDTSLDTDLSGNRIRIHFQHAPILDGISVHEDKNNVVILISTVASVHRLMFPHPDILDSHSKSFFTTSNVSPSIFFDAHTASLWGTGSVHLLNQGGSGNTLPLPHTSVSWLRREDQTACFALSYSNGTIQLVEMPPRQSEMRIISFEMKPSSSVMSRLWNGIVPTAMRGNIQEAEDVALSLACLEDVGQDQVIFAFCKDFHLRMWSCQRRECILNASVLEYCTKDTKKLANWTTSGRQPSLRVVKQAETNSFLVCVYVGLPEIGQFCLFQPIMIAGQYQLAHLASICAPDNTLTDFLITSSQLWTLWVDSNSEPIILFQDLDMECGQKGIKTWKSVLLNAVHLETPLTFHQPDPREAYLQDIFQPGKFSAATISKAISIYCRSSDPNFIAHSISRPDLLKEKVSYAVENEIRLKAIESVLSDDQFLELQIDCWERFFSYCLQYHEVGTKSLGLFIDNVSGLACLVRKNTLSILRPCDPLESLILSDCTDIHPDRLLPFVNDPGLCISALTVLNSLELLRSSLSEDMIDNFDHSLFYLEKPDNVVEEMLSLGQTESLLTTLSDTLQTTPRLIGTLQALLQALGPVTEDYMDLEDEDKSLCSRFLSGSAGVDLLCKSMRQLVKGRYLFCRDLLILQNLIAKIGVRCGLTNEKVVELTSKLSPLTSMYIQSYYVMYWATQTVATPIKPNILNNTLREMSFIVMPEAKLENATNASGRISYGTILELFIAEQGGNLSRKMLSNKIQTNTSNGTFTDHFLSLRSILSQLIWPITVNMFFPEFLLSNSQYLPLQEYIRLLSSWCEWNNHSRLFLLACTHLVLGEPLKAVSIFSKASKGANWEDYLKMKIVPLEFQEMNDEEHNASLSHYFLKVIQLFSYFNLPDSIITLANEAIKVVPDEDSLLPTFWSLIFKYHLEMDHCTDAYVAMMNNPDPSRRKDCLRQLLVQLFERGHLSQLIEYDFVNVQDDVVAILESKARSTDLTNQRYYEFLYSYHFKSSNFRRAASAMYEYSSRLSREVPGVMGLSKQASCLLTTLNSLRLVNPKYSWIVKPVPVQQTDMVDHFGSMGLSPKRDYDGENVDRKCLKERRVEVLDLADIQKEYSLVHARLQLVRKNPEIATTHLSLEDTVAVMVSEGFFEAALALCKSNDVDLQPLFEGLAAKCVSSARLNQTNLNRTETNEDSFLNEEQTNQELWMILEKFLLANEKPSGSIYHRIVTEKILSAGFKLPSWLKKSYEVKNGPELLRLFLKHDMIEEANDLVCDYIDNVLVEARKVAEKKRIRLWLPYSLLDCLLCVLEDNKSDKNYIKMQTHLTEKLDKYFETLKFIGQSFIK